MNSDRECAKAPSLSSNERLLRSCMFLFNVPLCLLSHTSLAHLPTLVAFSVLDPRIPHYLARHIHGLLPVHA
ncbi:hypothetical protein DAEQUDRAFT_124166 [Daedalea quercina L-15889]|uniref:Uncharacterized protein n=1 Tax=Daedalea quercina L-15889 TaxID=1314783 RepID=A0A165RY55_9APHY|nr:hypothetical protein DAEQUDRAFT_124166 [Daedalea quercina L-15889]